jgi:hypothetical protein
MRWRSSRRWALPSRSLIKAMCGGARNLRELRPRGGRSPWRAFYRRIGEALVIGAIGPEARVDGRGFSHAVEMAEARLDRVESAVGKKRRRS